MGFNGIFNLIVILVKPSLHFSVLDITYIRITLNSKNYAIAQIVWEMEKNRGFILFSPSAISIRISVITKAIQFQI